MRFKHWAVACVAACAADAQSQAVIRVTAEPPGAAIEVDGLPVGVGRASLDVEPGEHRIRATMALHVPVEEIVRVARGDTLDVRLVLPVFPGRVRVAGLPTGADVVTPGWELVDGEATLPPGISTIQVRVPGQPAMSARFDVGANALTTIEYGDVLSARGFVSNFFLPGSAQIRQGRPVAGAAFGVGVGLGIGGTLAMSVPIAEADQDLEAAAEVYRAATSEAEVREALLGVNEAYDRTRSTRHLRVGIAAATFSVYVASLVDGAIRHGWRPGLRVRGPERPPEWAIRPTPRGLSASLTF